MIVLVRKHIEITGIVQGVGFRPAIHRLAKRCGVTGWIRNTSRGVCLEIQGSKEQTETFLHELPESFPPMAKVEHTSVCDVEIVPDEKLFEIRHSEKEFENNVLISPDIGICEDCRRELMDPEDRRFAYPFINCTNCGPRFTIVKDIPYDRARTSMARFSMCPVCEAEYEDIENRRYHAQPDCCKDCGPHVSFRDGEGHLLSDSDPEAIELAAGLLASGGILAVKGLGGFHLAVRADRASGIAELRRRKEREEKPFALMCRDLETAREIAEITEEEARLMQSPAKPITLVRKRKELTAGITDNPYVGIMLPYTPLHVLLLEAGPRILVMTSANLSDCPIIKDNEEAFEKLSGIADGFLMHDRDIVTRCDDSLVRIFDGRPYLLRRSRGYAPSPIFLDEPLPMLLACGAEQKASFALSKGSFAFYSQHIGDLKNWETYAHYEDQVSHFERLFSVRPEAVICDRHPDYLSSEFAAQTAKKEGIPCLQVQHHHAHMASCMADNRLSGEVIGLIWDGTGYGTDGTIWGGETLTGGYADFTRTGHMRPIPLPGGDACMKEIGRTAFSLILEAGADPERYLEEYREQPRTKAFRQMIRQGKNCPLSSGVGRLFDGVYAILTGKTQVSYEGQGAVLLETLAETAVETGDDSRKTYILDTYTEESSAEASSAKDSSAEASSAGASSAEAGSAEDCEVWDWRPLVREILAEVEAGVDAAQIAAAFCRTLVQAGVRQCRMAREKTGFHRVVLSGGVFQNMFLLSRLVPALYREGFQVYTHVRAAANDEGIALGQLMIGNARLKA